MLRILAIIILLFSVIFMPFWLSIVLALLGTFYFSFFWEAVFLFLVSDLLFGAREARFLNMTLISLIISILILITVEFAKRKLRFYDKRQ